MAPVLDLIKHYQHALEKYPNDEEKLLNCIDHLFHLDVTVQHLQETGVGRTVNALRKEPGDVGRASRALVYKWKMMVAAEESDQEGDHRNDTSNYNGHISEREGEENVPKSKIKHEQHEKSSKSSKSSKDDKKHKHINGNHSGSKRKSPSSEDEEPEIKKSKHSSSSDDRYKKKHIKQEPKDSDSDVQDSDVSHSENSESEMSQSSEENKKPRHKIKEEIKEQDKYSSSSKQHSQNTHRSHKSEPASEKSQDYSNKHSKHKSESKKPEKSHTIEKVSDSQKQPSSKDKESYSDKKHKSSHKSKEREKEKKSDESINKHSSSSKKDNSNDVNKHKHSEKHTTEKHRSSNERSEKEKQKTSSEKDPSSSKHKSTENNSSKHSSSSSKERSKEKHSSSKITDHSKKSDKKHSTESSSKSSSKDKHEKEKKEIERSNDKAKKHSSSSKSKSSSSKTKDDPPKKRHISNSEDSDDGIGCESGASFAEALGMISPTKPKKKPLSIKDISSPNSFSDLSPASLLAPTAKLAPLPALEISALPEISPHHKPRPLPKMMQIFSDDDAMNHVISSKNQRTKVYSGNKVIGKIPTLYEMCVQILQEHIDALEFTGGVPYEILKPVVDKATPQQLFILEHYNPYLMEDTDHLWQKFCEKHFRNKQRQEMETWREMYMRCQEEQEHRLKSLTANIRIAQEAKKAPIKQTKMAYVDTIVKPPRNIARKQALHGTAHASTASPAARVASLAAAPNVLRGGAVRPPPAPSVSTSTFNKPKKAPLMQKALQFMRGRKR